MSEPLVDALQQFFSDPEVVRWLQNAACAAGCSATFGTLAAVVRRLFRKKDTTAAPQPVIEKVSVYGDPEPPRSRACREALTTLSDASGAFYNDVNHCLFVPGLLVRFSTEHDRPPVASVLVKPQLKNGAWDGIELSGVLDPDEQQLVFEAARAVRAAIVAKTKKERNERLGLEMSMSRLAHAASATGWQIDAQASANGSDKAPPAPNEHWARMR